MDNGQICGFLGPNGAGKSTTMNLRFAGETKDLRAEDVDTWMEKFCVELV